MAKDKKLAPIKIELIFDPSTNSLSAGLRIEWFSGEDKNWKVNVTSGAGVGSPYIVFTLTDKKTGAQRCAVADVRKIVDPLAEALKQIPPQHSTK